jgi:hypothetical protein
MLDSPPGEKQWLSWLYVTIWSLMIYLTIPFARVIQKFVSRQWSSDLFTYGVLSAILLAIVILAVHIIRYRPISRSGYFWISTVGVVFIVYTIKLGEENPEEAVHFIQYGVLGVLAYRALAHRIRDISIFFSAAAICGIIGIIDEVIQWLTPQRYWDLRDVWLNFLAAALLQISIAKGLNPKIIARKISPANLRTLCRVTIVAAVLLGSSMLNTPARINWYAERIPLPDFLKGSDSVMVEYGYLYDDPDIGIFRSRFSEEELKQNDLKRADGASKILDLFYNNSTYQEFLKIYSPISDPFVHEARVHLYSRDKHFRTSKEYEDDPGKSSESLTKAFRENQVMEKYFPNTLYQSAYVWPEDKLALAADHLLPDIAFDSSVSRSLITSVSERVVAFFFAIKIIGLAVLHRHLGKNESRLLSNT